MGGRFSADFPYNFTRTVDYEVAPFVWVAEQSGKFTTFA